jgi:hypothetical protein
MGCAKLSNDPPKDTNVLIKAYEDLPYMVKGMELAHFMLQ